MKRKLYSYKYVPIIILIGTLMIFLSSCEKNEIPQEEPTPVLPVLTTTAPINVLQISAQCGGEITDDGGAEIVQKGVVWSTNPNPTVDLATKTTEGSGKGKFLSLITGLTPGTFYYVRAYATNSVGTSYGDATSMFFQTRPYPPGVNGLVTDASGNSYQTVQIGTQIWMVENLKTTKYRDGSSIPNVTDDAAWGLLTTGAYCEFKNDKNNGNIYGKLYNWYAVTDTRNLCPAGWHVPTDPEWTALSTFLGGNTIAGAKLKEAGSTHWYGANVFGTNEVGFTALPGDFRPSNGIIVYHLFFSAYFWTSTQASTANGYYNWIPYSDKLLTRSSTSKKVGYSVRCIKDPI